jgi:UDP-glucose 4-epimerase
VDFSLFAKLAPEHQPQMTLIDSIMGLINGLKSMEFSDTQFRASRYMRLHALQAHITAHRLSENLRWQMCDAVTPSALSAATHINLEA